MKPDQNLRFTQKTKKTQSSLHFGYFRGELDHPPRFCHENLRKNTLNLSKNRVLLSLTFSINDNLALHVDMPIFPTYNAVVNFIKVLHLYFTRVAIVYLTEHNNCTCKIQV